MLNSERTIILVYILLADFISIAAQTEHSWYYKHEVSSDVGLGVYGIGTFGGNRWHTFREQMEERFALSHEKGYAHLTIPLGVHVGLRYMYSFNKHVAIGVQLSYFGGSLHYDYYTKEERIEIAPHSFKTEDSKYDNPTSIRVKALNMMPTIKWAYSKYLYVRGGLGIQYGSYCLDATVIDASVSSPIYDSQWLFAYQIVPLGVEFAVPGNELSTLIFKKVSPLYFRAELGYGMEGIVNIGLVYKFSRCSINKF